MPTIISAGSDHSASPLLRVAPQTGSLLLLSDLTGGDETKARTPVYGPTVAELSLSGTPSYKRHAAIVDADNHFGTTLQPNVDFDDANMTFVAVCFRQASSHYLGNLDQDATCDALIETNQLVTRYRYRSSSTNINVDVAHPCPAGAPFFFAVVATASGASAYVFYQGRMYIDNGAGTETRNHDGTTRYRIGAGQVTPWTDAPFPACGAAVWNRALTVGGLGEVYGWYRHRLSRNGVHI